MPDASKAAWARSAADPLHALYAYQETIPIELIATLRRDFRVCRRDEPMLKLVERHLHDQLDHLPVVDPSSDPEEPIVGVLNVAELTDRGKVGGCVDEWMEPLQEGHLIGADTSILSFIRGAHERPFRLVVSGPEIIGLVSISDLQRLPVRAALFALVTYLEMVMAESIRKRIPEPEEWMNLLSDGRRRKLLEQAERGRAEDTLIDLLFYTQFSDKVTIIKKIAKEEESPDWSPQSFKDDLSKIERLRDALAHASEYAASLASARGVCQNVRAMDRWIKDLTRWAPLGVGAR